MSQTHLNEHEAVSVQTRGFFIGELRIARGKFSQLKEQAKENLAIAGQSAKPFVNSQKVSEVQKVNTTQVLADELKTSYDTSSRIIQIQAKAKNGFRF